MRMLRLGQFRGSTFETTRFGLKALFWCRHETSCKTSEWLAKWLSNAPSLWRLQTSTALYKDEASQNGAVAALTTDEMRNMKPSSKPKIPVRTFVQTPLECNIWMSWILLLGAPTHLLLASLIEAVGPLKGAGGNRWQSMVKASKLPNSQFASELVKNLWDPNTFSQLGLLLLNAI